MQEAKCNDNYTNMALSMARPLEVLTIIHDKLDHAKTSSPCFAHRLKVTDGLFNLHLSITNMVLFNVL